MLICYGVVYLPWCPCTVQMHVQYWSKFLINQRLLENQGYTLSAAANKSSAILSKLGALPVYINLSISLITSWSTSVMSTRFWGKKEQKQWTRLFTSEFWHLKKFITNICFQNENTMCLEIYILFCSPPFHVQTLHWTLEIVLKIQYHKFWEILIKITQQENQYR